jgi:tRNA A-37 threonylcarbamoyl transferase component Bud32
VADEAGRTGRPPTDDGAEITRGRYALGEFTITPRSALDEERPPGLLGKRYEVGRLIGSGGTARVYRAYDVRLGREVAVKIYDRDAVALDQRRRLREMTIQGSISHPGVVALLDSGTEGGRTYLVMQLVEGENLAERLLSGPLPAAEVTALADGLAEALAHVHARRIVHRDLKPANVFLSADGPLIGDFGIAHALDTTHITGTGLIPGTAAYLAPEQVSGEPAGPPADVYALGLILLECLTGRREYPGTMVEAAMARLTRPPRVPEEAPAALGYTLRRMTQRDPADRPAAEKVREMLHRPPPTLPWNRTRNARWRRRLVAAEPREDTTAAFSPARGVLGAAGDSGAAAGAVRGDLPAAGDAAIDPGPGRGDLTAAGDATVSPSAARGDKPTAIDPGPARGDQAASAFGDAAATPGVARGGQPAAIDPASARGDQVTGAFGGAARGGQPASGAIGGAAAAHDSAPEGATQHHDLTAVPVPAENPRRRRLAAAGGLTAAAVAAVAAMFLTDQDPGTGSPAQPPAAHSTTATAGPSSSTPLAESGTLAPKQSQGPGGSGSRPGTSEPGTSEAASLEPAAVTQPTPSSITQPSSKHGKPPKTDPPGQTRGKGPGHDD